MRPLLLCEVSTTAAFEALARAAAAAADDDEKEADGKAREEELDVENDRDRNRVVNVITFTDGLGGGSAPKAIDGIAPPYPAPQRCAVTGLPAGCTDPAAHGSGATEPVEQYVPAGHSAHWPGADRFVNGP